MKESYKNSINITSEGAVLAILHWSKSTKIDFGIQMFEKSSNGRDDA